MWNGALAFYTPVPIFVVWIVLFTLVLHRGTGLGLTRGPAARSAAR